MDMYKFINYLFNSSHEIIKLKYKIDNEDKIQIFGAEFSGNNNNKYLIIYKDKIAPFQSYFLLKDINKDDIENKKFEILLLVLEDISDRSYMFYNCESLVEYDDFVITKNEINDNSIEKEDYLDFEEINKYNDYYSNRINEDIIKEKNSSFNETCQFFLHQYNKFDKEKTNIFHCLKNLSYTFSGCSSLITLPDISTWNTNYVKSMNSKFSRCSSLSSLPDISKWNINNVEDMNSMFSRCSSLISLPDISKWNTKNIEIRPTSSNKFISF